MRVVCFVKRLEFEFHGNVYKNAIALGDVDNDGEIELVIGNMNGDLVIYKGKKCWQKLSGLGVITAVGIGDVMNCDSNALVVICGDGWCHIYMCLRPKSTEVPVQKSVKLVSVHDQRIPPNTSVLLLEDIDADGNKELVLGLTDRVVRSYRWQIQSKLTGGTLVCLNKWECANQIGSLTLNYDANGLPCLLIAQPGGTFMRIRPILSKELMEKEENRFKRNENEMKVDYHLLSLSRMRNPNILTEIVGNINQGVTRSKNRGSPYAVTTLDGTLMMVQDEEIIWSIQVDHQLFVLTKLDIVGDGRDEIVACSWDGQTYILDQEKHSVRFQLEEAVSAFCAGHYTLKHGDSPVPCFIYTTFTNKVYLYYDIKLESMTTKNLLTNIKEDTEIEEIFEKDIIMDKKSVKNLVEWCLYNNHTK
uniref:Integrin-alpha FG-GAP repeat-containing protein 2 n=1 Tax=Clastoptera arizonana TaxID=38151 RepID=A0A1B6DEV0_9HEMI